LTGRTPGLDTNVLLPYLQGVETVGFSEGRLFEFSRRLLSANTHEDLLAAVAEEIRSAVGYNVSWLSVLLPEHGTFKAMLLGAPVEDLWDDSAEIPIAGDAMVEQLIETRLPVVVEDAQSDPRVNREVVEMLGSRTIVNIPLLLIDSTYGALGTGTFGDEGVKVPTAAELDHLIAVGNVVVLASARILLAREKEERIRRQAETDRLLADRQRIESMGAIAGGVAHDFNNMLTVILGAAQLLRGQLTEARQFENLRLIERAGRSASELAEQLLTLGRRRELAAEPIDVGVCARTVAAMLDRVLGPGITVELAVEPGLPQVLADPRQIEQVLMNLGLNAGEAMPDGGAITVSLTSSEFGGDAAELRPWAGPGPYVRIAVTDDGVGIEPEALERIFEPFYTTRSDSGGTGLGLSVTRATVEQHGGFVQALSSPGDGTSILVHLPALPADHRRSTVVAPVG
jgi:signal transduction histidine kinase